MAKEYIEREAVERYIEGLYEPWENQFQLRDNIARRLRAIPVVEAVEVVRCKDCKYQDDCARQMVHTTRDYVLEQNISAYNKVDFCSYGERKKNEG